MCTEQIENYPAPNVVVKTLKNAASIEKESQLLNANLVEKVPPLTHPIGENTGNQSV